MLIQSPNGQNVPDPKFLLRTETRDYLPNAYRSYYFYQFRTPPFSLRYVESMCGDPHIALGLQLLKGPIMAKARFYVDCDNNECKEFLKKNISRFWRNSAFRALRCIEWGYAPTEVIYKEEDGNLEFSVLKDIQSLDCRAVTDNGYYVGFTVRNIVGKGKTYVPGPKGFWSLHDRQHHPFYGRSRLYYPYLPWIEMWGEGGYRESRKVFYYRASHTGARIWFPPGTTPNQVQGSGAPGGQTGVYGNLNNKDIARELVEKMRSGSTLALPSLPDDQPQWKIEDPQPIQIPAALEDWGDRLRKEQWEGLGILSEVAEAEGTGAYAGRQVPQEAFYSILQTISNDLISDADEQIFRWLVTINFGNVPYEIIPFRLLREEDQAAGEGAISDAPPSAGNDGRIIPGGSSMPGEGR